MRQPGFTHGSSYPSPTSLSRERLDILNTQVARSVSGSRSDAPDVLIAEAIRTAIDVFVATSADIHVSVTQVAPLFDKIGCREAHLHPATNRLHQSFKLANVAAQRGLVQVVGDLMTHDVLMQLRQDLMAYLAQLHRMALAGFERTCRLKALTHEERLAELRAIVFWGASPRDVDQLAPMIDFNPDQRVTAIISVKHKLPDVILQHPQVLTDESGTMALLAEEWDIHLSSIPFRGQAVLGPASTVAASHDGVALARNATALLRDGTVIDNRVVVPAIDLLGELLVRGNRLLAELLVDKHLTSLEALPIRRRLDLAEILLISLERGLPLNRIARELGLAAQTAHNRMNSLRSLFGPKLEDADQRLELIVALRAGLARWSKP